MLFSLRAPGAPELPTLPHPPQPWGLRTASSPPKTPTPPHTTPRVGTSECALLLSERLVPATPIRIRPFRPLAESRRVPRRKPPRPASPKVPAVPQACAFGVDIWALLDKVAAARPEAACLKNVVRFTNGKNSPIRKVAPDREWLTQDETPPFRVCRVLEIPTAAPAQTAVATSDAQHAQNAHAPANHQGRGHFEHTARPKCPRKLAPGLGDLLATAGNAPSRRGEVRNRGVVADLPSA